MDADSNGMNRLEFVEFRTEVRLYIQESRRLMQQVEELLREKSGERERSRQLESDAKNTRDWLQRLSLDVVTGSTAQASVDEQVRSIEERLEKFERDLKRIAFWGTVIYGAGLAASAFLQAGFLRF